jgi:hypothetical protein
VKGGEQYSQIMNPLCISMVASWAQTNNNGGEDLTDKKKENI